MSRAAIGRRKGAFDLSLITTLPTPPDRMMPQSAMRSRGLVSVIIPTFNRAAMLIELLDALARQSWPEIEIIVVDDGASDDTQARLDSWSAVHRGQMLKRLATPNLGCGGARNAGLAQAAGAFVHFIDDDDIVLPHGIETMVAAIERAGAPYCVGQAVITYRDRVPMASNTAGRSRLVPHSPLLCRWVVHAALYRRAAIERAGLFDATLARNEDVEFHARLAASNPPGVAIADIVAERRLHGGGQMSVGLLEADFYAGLLIAAHRFLAWASANRALDARAAIGALKMVLLCCIKVRAGGAAVDPALLAQSMALLQRAAPLPAMLVALLLAPKRAGYYRLIDRTLGMVGIAGWNDD